MFQLARTHAHLDCLHHSCTAARSATLALLPLAAFAAAAAAGGAVCTHTARSAGVQALLYSVRTILVSVVKRPGVSVVSVVSVSMVSN